jgi:23S rRNA pseudouridine1911/1915/1917 synthase
MLKYKLIEKTDEFIVVNKPAGLITHRAPHISEESLADQVSKNFPDIKGVGEDEFRPGIMHRLDKLASGLMVLARTQESYESLKKQFKERTVEKKYSALVYGKIIKDYNEINFLITRSIKGGKMAALPLTKKGKANFDGRNARTLFEVKQRFINYTFIEAKIETGRTHQVRVHMAAYGCPLVGDNLYGTRKTKLKNEKLKMKRIFLVADYLSFLDLDGKKHEYQIELPGELEDLLRRVK